MWGVVGTMARVKRRSNDFLLFLAVTLAASVVVGAIGYAAGRAWVAKYLVGAVRRGQPPALSPQAQEQVKDRGGVEPGTPVVIISEREPTEAERRELLGEAAIEEPEATEEPAAGEEAIGAEGQPLPEDQTATERGQPEAPEGALGYVVTAGAYRDKDRAQRVAASLREAGFEPEIQPIERDGETLYRVRVAEVETREQAQIIQEEVTSHGLPSSIIPPVGRQ